MCAEDYYFYIFRGEDPLDYVIWIFISCPHFIGGVYANELKLKLHLLSLLRVK